MKITITLLLLLVNFFSFSQDKENYIKKADLDPNSLTNKEYFNQRKLELEGTYQFRVTKDGYAVILSPETLTMVEENRKQDTDYLVLISENVYLFVPSFETIDDPNFEPLPIVKYISSNSINISE